MNAMFSRSWSIGWVKSVAGLACLASVGVAYADAGDVEHLRQRMVVLLKPSPQETVSTPQARGLSRAAYHEAQLVEAVARLERGVVRDPVTLSEVEDAPHLRMGMVGTKRIRVDLEQGEVDVVDEEEREEGFFQDLQPVDMLDRMAPLLEAIGVDSKEMELQFGRIGASSLEIGDTAPSAPEVVEHKMRVNRFVAGLPVVGDRITASFSADGQFRRLRGRWRHLARLPSRVEANWSEHALVERGLQRLRELGKGRKLQIHDSAPLNVQARWLPLAWGTGDWVLELWGAVDVPVKAPGGGYKRSRHEYRM